MEVWKNRFRNLAEDHSGNRKSSGKWESVIDNDVEIFPENYVKKGEVTKAMETSDVVTIPKKGCLKDTKN
ncbi:hypothetical protein AYI70_g7341 [Smittium culicis]|uniref:Uncharacterized protein n=1 Tax=Smittium culicis TaxID=133412 RepID=A0A1R1XL25_9FUNG|nr:hypothetical protein AYI70_g7341 [Smittium culicis]